MNIFTTPQITLQDEFRDKRAESVAHGTLVKVGGGGAGISEKNRDVISIFMEIPRAPVAFAILLQRDIVSTDSENSEYGIRINLMMLMQHKKYFTRRCISIRRTTYYIGGQRWKENR